MGKAATGAVIVAAGLSSRMREFKPLLPVGDSSFIRRIVSSFRAAGVSDIAVVTGHNAEALQEHLSGLGVACLRNEDYATSDMFSSVRIGLLYIGGRCGRAFLTPVDVPVFGAAGLPPMLAVMDARGAPAVLPSYRGRRGHPVLIGCGAIPGILAYRGDMGLKGALSALGDSVMTLELDDPGLVIDADEPEDYRSVLRYANELGIPT